MPPRGIIKLTVLCLQPRASNVYCRLLWLTVIYAFLYGKAVFTSNEKQIIQRDKAAVVLFLLCMPINL